jgi:hypothetical protein
VHVISIIISNTFGFCKCTAKNAEGFLMFWQMMLLLSSKFMSLGGIFLALCIDLAVGGEWEVQS